MKKNKSDAALFWILQQLPRMGLLRLREIWKTKNNLSFLIQLTDQELVDQMGWQREQILSWRRFLDLQFEKIFYDQCHRAQVNFCCWGDELYPEILFTISDPPPLLFYRGDFSLLHSSLRVALVGTREMSSSARLWIQRIIPHLVRKNIITVSGLARGVDAEVHRQTLDSGGKTVAVTALGVDGGFPKANSEMQKKIAEQGLVISEWLEPPGHIPADRQFPRRNRIISGISSHVVIVEAAVKSGALVTARLALEQGREVFAVPGDVNSRVAQGTNQLIRDGALVALEARDILQALGCDVRDVEKTEEKDFSIHEKCSQDFSEKFSEDAKQILALCREPIGLDEMVLRTGKSAPLVMKHVTQLELEGYLVLTAPGVYSVSSVR